MGYADLHIHSLYSYDASTTVRAILKHAADVGLDVIAVTDHDDLRGSIEACQLASSYGVEVIPAAEVSTRDGHVLALFIKTLPPARMSLADTLLHIGRQGGIAILPHPFNNLPPSIQEGPVFSALADPRLKSVLKGIETDNMTTQSYNSRVHKLCPYLPLAKIASSDAHMYWAIGAARTEFPGKTASDLRHALDLHLTVPIPYDSRFLPHGILRWLRYMFLRKFGYGVDVRADQQVDTQRLSNEYVRYVRSRVSEKK